MANPLSYVAINLSAQTLNLVAGIVIARALMPEARGELGIVMLGAGAIGALSAFSLDSAILMAGPRFRSVTTLGRAVLQASVRLLPLVPIGAAIVAIFFGWRLGWPHVPLMGLLAIVVAISMVGLTVALAIPKCRFDRRLWLQGRLVQGCVQLSATFGLWWIGHWLLEGFLVVTALSHLTGMAWITVSLVRRSRLDPVPPNAPGCRRGRRLLLIHARRNAPAGWLSFVNDNVDLFIVAALLSDFEVGLYAVACRLLAPADTLTTSLYAYLLPRLTDPQAKDRAIADWADTSKAFCLLLAVMAAVLVLAADPLIFLTVGPAYGDAAPIIQVLAVGVLLDGVLTAFSGLLRATGHYRVLMKLEAYGLLVNAPIIALFVTQFGYLGAALAGVAGQAAAAAFLAVVLYRHHRTALVEWRRWGRDDINRAAGYCLGLLGPLLRRRSRASAEDRS